MDLPRDLLQAIGELCRRWPAVRRVWLYGSRAQGRAGRASDIDLAVEMPGAGPGEWAALWLSLKEDLPTLREVDAVRWEEAPKPLREQILAQGIVIYDGAASSC